MGHHGYPAGPDVCAGHSLNCYCSMVSPSQVVCTSCHGRRKLIVCEQGLVFLAGTPLVKAATGKDVDEGRFAGVDIGKLCMRSCELGVTPREKGDRYTSDGHG
jgi:hypothetical protein